MRTRQTHFQRLRSPILLMVAVGIAVALLSLTQTLDGTPAALVPASQTDAWWISRHAATVARVHEGDIDLIMIGDSITQGWSREGRAVWDAYYGDHQAMNLGFDGDRTEHVLWRLDHGEIEGIKPKLAVVMIGTNNTSTRHDSPKETAAGIQAIFTTLHAHLPATKILLLGLFPRAASPDDPLCQLNEAINTRLRLYADNQQVFFLDLSRRFLDDQGRLSQDLMPDYLHPSEGEYRLWAEGMEETVRKLLGK